MEKEIKDLKLKKFYDLTEKDFEEMVKGDEKAIKEGRFTPMEDVFKELDDKYGL